jgi:hypothetical protein
VIYGFGVASGNGNGFGSSLSIGDTIHYQSSQWMEEWGAESSNFRELNNLINALESAQNDGLLENTELFMFTDNSTTKSAVFKGTSASRILFELVLRLQNLQMHGQMILHVIHISGRRMIAQGMDGLSRGNLHEGVFKGGSFLEHSPSHLNAVERQGQGLVNWVESWLSSLGPIKWLSPKDWFLSGHTRPLCVWFLAPGAAKTALEQLGKATHKRGENTHLVIIPRLLTTMWRITLNKICYLTFTLPMGNDVWSNSQFDPLVFGLSLPLIRHPPWKLKRLNLVVDVERMLLEVPLPACGWGRNILRKFLLSLRMKMGLRLSTLKKRIDSFKEGMGIT